MATGRVNRRFPVWLGGLPAAVAVVCAVMYLAPATPGLGQDAEQVLRVEEDWELVLNEPGNRVNAPQFHTIMSPVSDTESVYAQVTWNYREVPDAAPGGVQIQAWSGDQVLQIKDRVSDQFSTVAETVSWTQRLETNGSLLLFRVLNGSSTTWGSFGGSEWNVEGHTDIPNLNSYSPGVSTSGAAITYGSNRVDSLILKQVRYYGVNGLISTDSVERVVFKAK